MNKIKNGKNQWPHFNVVLHVVAVLLLASSNVDGMDPYGNNENNAGGSEAVVVAPDGLGADEIEFPLIGPSSHPSDVGADDVDDDNNNNS